jgi:hypothetical protein
MPETIKLTEEEFKGVQEIQNKYNETVFKFGQFYLERLNLDEKIKNLVELEEKTKEELSLIQKEEQEWINKISSKYGDGSLSLKDGTFIPKE